MRFLYIFAVTCVALVTVSDAAGPWCFSCASAFHPAICQKVVQCAADESCMTEKRRGNNGAVLYDSGCMTQTDCAAISQGQTTPGALCSECCQGALCNIDKCGAVNFRQANETFCLNCAAVQSPEYCDTVAKCDKDETCSLTIQKSFGMDFFKSSCREKTKCPPPTASLVTSNDTCCEGDLCNSNDQGVVPNLYTTTPKPAAGPATAGFDSSTFTYNMTFAPGETMELVCRVRGGPAPSITWSFTNGSSTYNLPSGFHRVASGDSILAIPGPDKSDAGKYTCSASNYLGTANAILDVDVLAPPRISGPLNNSLVVDIKDTVELQCDVEEAVTPSVSTTPTVSSTTTTVSSANSTAPPSSTTAYPSSTIASSPIPTGSHSTPNVNVTWIIPPGVTSYTITDNNTLILYNVHLENEDVYICLAENLDGVREKFYYLSLNTTDANDTSCACPTPTPQSCPPTVSLFSITPSSLKTSGSTSSSTKTSSIQPGSTSTQGTSATSPFTSSLLTSMSTTSSSVSSSASSSTAMSSSTKQSTTSQTATYSIPTTQTQSQQVNMTCPTQTPSTCPTCPSPTPVTCPSPVPVTCPTQTPMTCPTPPTVTCPPTVSLLSITPSVSTTGGTSTGSSSMPNGFSSTPTGSTPTGSTPTGSTPVGSTPMGSTPTGSVSQAANMTCPTPKPVTCPTPTPVTCPTATSTVCPKCPTQTQITCPTAQPIPCSTPKPTVCPTPTPNITCPTPKLATCPTVTPKQCPPIVPVYIPYCPTSSTATAIPTTAPTATTATTATTAATAVVSTTSAPRNCPSPTPVSCPPQKTIYLPIQAPCPSSTPPTPVSCPPQITIFPSTTRPTPSKVTTPSPLVTTSSPQQTQTTLDPNLIGQGQFQGVRDHLIHVYQCPNSFGFPVKWTRKEADFDHSLAYYSTSNANTLTVNTGNSISPMFTGVYECNLDGYPLGQFAIYTPITVSNCYEQFSTLTNAPGTVIRATCTDMCAHIQSTQSTHFLTVSDLICSSARIKGVVSQPGDHVTYMITTTGEIKFLDESGAPIVLH